MGKGTAAIAASRLHIPPQTEGAIDWSGVGVEAEKIAQTAAFAIVGHRGVRRQSPVGTQRFTRALVTPRLYHGGEAFTLNLGNRTHRLWPPGFGLVTGVTRTVRRTHSGYRRTVLGRCLPVGIR
jgi:hypothetical protein